MARKSQALRLEQAETLLAAYDTAGLGAEYNARFIRDMVSRLQRAKYPTKRQRDWLDGLIDEGIPAPKGDLVYIAALDEALATEGIDFAEILTDFRGKLARGWDLSVKQKAWCDSLLEKAKSLRDGTFWRPDEETTERLKLAVEVAVCYNSMYWSTHGGMAKALNNVRLWLTGEAKMVDEWSVKMALKAVTGKLKLMESPRFNVGDKCFVSRRVRNEKTGMQETVSVFGIIIDGPKVGGRDIVYDILVGAEVISTSDARKRR